MKELFNKTVSKLKMDVTSVDYYLKTYLDINNTGDYYSCLDNVGSKIGVDFGINPVLDDSIKSVKYIPYLIYRPGNITMLKHQRIEYDMMSHSKAVNCIAKEWMYMFCRISEIDLKEKLL